MKDVIQILVTLIMVAGFLTGCGKTEKAETAGQSDEAARAENWEPETASELPEGHTADDGHDHSDHEGHDH
jgi:hypothetical protein